MRRISLPAVCAASLAAWACGPRGCIELTRETPLLAEPRPPGYPSTRPLPNRVIATLEPGRYPVRSTRQEKDYRYFELRTPQGHGYVIDDAGTVDCR